NAGSSAGDGSGNWTITQVVRMAAKQGSSRWWHRSVAEEAEFLDGVVDAQLEFIRELAVDQREELAEALAVLVMLAQDHRHYGRSWISRRELRRRVDRALVTLDALGALPAEDTPAPHRVD
ncbi:MAG TPA: hypothetical protein VFO16_16825, partial [Pseudonocardiaceae bacterium]|nr:hypothetical protein [Pseudonocardiaceae bacterium]